jgi:hypothetical protein
MSENDTPKDPMTVRLLLELFSEMDPDLEVRVPGRRVGLALRLPGFRQYLTQG